MARKLSPTEGDSPAPPETPEAPAMAGGPGQPTVEEPPAPQYREIVIKGRKFQADPELYETLIEREKDFDRKLQQNSAELGELRRTKQEFETLRQTRNSQYELPKKEDWDVLLFENPSRAKELLKEEMRAEYRTEKQKDEERQQQARATEEFWNGFYRKNKDLDREEDGPLIQGILNTNLASLYHLPTEEGQEKLADLTRRQMLRYSQKAKLEDNEFEPAAPRTRVEGASHPAARPPAKEPQGPSTLTDVLQARRKARSKTAA